MAAARARQAAFRLASTLASTASAAGQGSSGGGGSGGRQAAFSRGKAAVAVTAAATLAYAGVESHLMETVPYGDSADGPHGGRQRGPKPLWAALLGGWRPQPLDHATTTLVAEQGHPEVLQQLGPDGLQPVPAGEVRTHWILPEEPQAGSSDVMLHMSVRLAVEESMQAVAAALRQEAEAKGFGKHVLKHGLHLVVTANEHGMALALAPDIVLLTAGKVRTIMLSTARQGQFDLPAAMAALQFVLAHEVAHLYLQHAEEHQLLWASLRGQSVQEQCIELVPGLSSVARWLRNGPKSEEGRASDYLGLSSAIKELSWRYEYEADEVACALLERLRLSPEHISAGMAALAAAHAADASAKLQALIKLKQQLSPEEKRKIATNMGWPDGDFDGGLSAYQAAVERGDPDMTGQLFSLWEAERNLRQLLALAEGSGGDADSIASQGCVTVGHVPISPAFVAGPVACPQPVVHAALADLADTHPPYGARLARIRHLTGQLPMLQRATAPPVLVDGLCSHASVAEQVAERLAQRMQAEQTAARETAAERAAEEQAAAAGFGGAAGKGAAAAGVVAAGLVAAAALLAAAVN